jgi:hypothetical protein
VSEGTRLRLPWAPRVPWLEANPERVLDLRVHAVDVVVNGTVVPAGSFEVTRAREERR